MEEKLSVKDVLDLMSGKCPFCGQKGTNYTSKFRPRGLRTHISKKHPEKWD